MNEGTAIVVREPMQAFEAEIVELERAGSSAVALREAFEGMFRDLEEWERRAKAIRVTSVEDVRGMKTAREIRLALKEIRVSADKKRKALKENALREGRAIDGLFAVLKGIVEPLEKKLEADEKFAERAEAEAKRKLGEERAELLRALGTDPAQFANLGEMDLDTWESTKETARLAKEAREEKARKDEAVRVEAERIAAENARKEREEAVRREAERVERERQQAEENARLAKELEQREAEQKAEREKHAAELKEKEAEAAAERQRANEERAAAADRERIAKQEKERAELEAKAARETLEKAERDATEKLERDKAEAKRKAEEEALAPDKQKIAQLAMQLRSFPLPTFTTAKGKAAGEKIANNFERLAMYLDKTAVEL